MDDVVSECGLDDFEEWDLKLNNNTKEESEYVIETVLGLLNHSVCN